MIIILWIFGGLIFVSAIMHAYYMGQINALRKLHKKIDEEAKKFEQGFAYKKEDKDAPKI